MLITNLKYEGYDAGLYGLHNQSGITLHFYQLDTGVHFYTIFNVNLTKQRGPNKGALLPKKKFWITRKFKFYNFWHNVCELPAPSRGLSSFHDCMGKMKSLTFQAESDNGEKLNKNTFKTITSYKIPTTIRQIADKSPIISSDIEVAYDEDGCDFEQILTTCENNHVISKQGNKITRAPVLASNRSYTDTKGWLLTCDELF
jgi:hypothetical protein